MDKKRWGKHVTKMEEVLERGTRLHNEELHNLYTSPSVRVIKARRISVAHVARIGFYMENMKRRDHVEDLGADRRIILEWIFGK
jgi:hypothetical protein